MLRYYHYSVCIILTGFMLTALTQHNSAPKWFNTVQRCNCEGNKQCNSDGTCSPKGCDSSYVGVTCQHASLLLFEPSPTFTNVPKELRDGDDSTCLAASVHNTSVIKIKNAVHFVWIYISGQNPIRQNPHIELHKKGSNQTISPVYTKLDSKSILIKSSLNVLYDTIRLSKLPDDACTLDVSIGRNVAGGSTPSQSSVNSLYNMNESANALLAVDGNDMNSPICVGTLLNTRSHSEWWETQLRFDSIVNAVLIISHPTRGCRMFGFVLEMYLMKNRTFSHTDKRSSQGAAAAKNVFIPVARTARRVKIILYPLSGTYCSNLPELNMREVYIFGEFICPHNSYGPTCDNNCPGCSRNICDPDWGCSTCKKDWAGHWCETDCRFRYGPQCQFECSAECGGYGDCNRTTGTCHQGCRKGFFTPKCSEPCISGNYGENCSKVCSGCKLNTTTGLRPCDGETGECQLGCSSGMEGDTCEGIIISDPLYKTVGKNVIKVFLGIFALLVLYKSCVISDEASLTEENAEETDHNKVVDKKDDIETVQPEQIEKVQPKPIEKAQPKPIKKEQAKLIRKAKPKPKEIVQSEPIEIAQPEPLEIVQPDPIEIVQTEPIELIEIVEHEPIVTQTDRHSSSRSDGASSDTLGSSMSDSTTRGTKPEGFGRKDSLFRKFHLLIAHQKKNLVTGDNFNLQLDPDT